MDPMDERRRLNAITENIITASMKVHSALGPDLLESAYEACLEYELLELQLKVERQKPMSLLYRGVDLDCGYRLDLFVEDAVIVEIKSVEALLSIHQAQLLSYLKIADRRIGLLINFNVQSLRAGIRRVVRNF